ncbi:hypothetical protein [Candidatus Hecatella orcuttiae]|jgi:hypothetical protein|uniref:transcriptional regulator n=1 Tax=Candidatus Hecatella orcuttiae TaxID=1935119 RepID=UPI002867BD4F|nr:hypothetical protein [Candidatus Hecatella orcuttiae]
MRHPSADVARYLLPAVNALIARELVEKYGLKRSEAAKVMEVTPAAVTQYLKLSRGGKIVEQLEGSEKIMRIIFSLARRMRTGKVNSEGFNLAIRRVCREARTLGIIPCQP